MDSIDIIRFVCKYRASVGLHKNIQMICNYKWWILDSEQTHTHTHFDSNQVKARNSTRSNFNYNNCIVADSNQFSHSIECCKCTNIFQCNTPIFTTIQFIKFNGKIHSDYSNNNNNQNKRNILLSLVENIWLLNSFK